MDEAVRQILLGFQEEILILKFLLVERILGDLWVWKVTMGLVELG